MPAVGYLLGVQFRDKITAVDHWIAFILLALIGANMIKEACSGDCEEENESLDIRTMFLLAVATSIDALAVGITFAFLNVHLLAAVSFIGATTFTLSSVGVKIGNVFGTRYKARAEFAGGVILILLGIKNPSGAPWCFNTYIRITLTKPKAAIDFTYALCYHKHRRSIKTE